jgi:chromosome segregation ATPase
MEQTVIETSRPVYDGTVKVGQRTETRVIEQRQEQPRIRKPKLPDPDTIRQEIQSPADDIAQAKVDYVEMSQNLDEFYAPLKVAERSVELLREQLAKAEATLKELQARASGAEARQIKGRQSSIFQFHAESDIGIPKPMRD